MEPGASLKAPLVMAQHQQPPPRVRRWSTNGSETAREIRKLHGAGAQQADDAMPARAPRQSLPFVMRAQLAQVDDERPARRAAGPSSCCGRGDSCGSRAESSCTCSCRCCASDESAVALFARRIPWLLALMMFQSASSLVLARYEELIENNLVIASFLTMLVGGGGNVSGRVIAELMKRLARGEGRAAMTGVGPGRRAAGGVWVGWTVVRREILVAIALSVVLGLAAFPRVRFLHADATNLDGFAIALSYSAIVVVAVVLALFVTLGMAAAFGTNVVAVGTPPVVMVLVDVLGIIVTMLVCDVLLDDLQPSANLNVDLTANPSAKCVQFNATHTLCASV